MAGELVPLERLEELLTEKIQKRGGRLILFYCWPSRREVSILAELDEDLFLDEEGKVTKDAFDDIMANFTVLDKDEEDVEVIADLASLAEKLRDPNEGIL